MIEELNTQPEFDTIFGWMGREFDSETNLQYNRARYCDQNTGRFISQDPTGIELSGDYNLYRYAGNNPLNVSDPTGLASRVLGNAAATSSATSHVASSLQPDFSWMGPNFGLSDSTIRSVNSAQAEVWRGMPGIERGSIREFDALVTNGASERVVRSYDVRSMWDDYDASVAAGAHQPNWFESNVTAPMARTFLPRSEPDTVYVYADGHSRIGKEKGVRTI